MGRPLAVLLPGLGLLGLCALPASPAAAQQEGEPGARVYAKYCAQCHNDNGDGRGIAAPYLSPPPRDFTSGKYKLRSTPTGTVSDGSASDTELAGVPSTLMVALPVFDPLVAVITTVPVARPLTMPSWLTVALE